MFSKTIYQPKPVSIKQKDLSGKEIKYGVLQILRLCGMKFTLVEIQK